MARTQGGNEEGNDGPIAHLICGLVTDHVITGDLDTTGCGSHLDALYVLAQDTRMTPYLIYADQTIRSFRNLAQRRSRFLFQGLCKLWH